MVEVTRGLSPGERIVTGGNIFIDRATTAQDFGEMMMRQQFKSQHVANGPTPLIEEDVANE